MADNLGQGALEDWREKYPRLFDLCEAAQDTAADRWEVALAGAEGRDRELLATLKGLLDASGGAVRLHLDGPVPRLDPDPAWAAANGEAMVDITALVYGTGAAAVRRWLVGGGEDGS